MRRKILNKDWWPFFKAVGEHWAWFTGSTVLAVLAAFVQGVGAVIPHWILWAFAATGLIVSAFLAWQDQYHAFKKLQKDNDRRTSDLTTGHETEIIRITKEHESAMTAIIKDRDSSVSELKRIREEMDSEANRTQKAKASIRSEIGKHMHLANRLILECQERESLPTVLTMNMAPKCDAWLRETAEYVGKNVGDHMMAILCDTGGLVYTRNEHDLIQWMRYKVKCLGAVLEKENQWNVILPP